MSDREEEMFVRPDYIESVKPFMNTPLVKILAGVRRSGKSTVLEMIKGELLRLGASAENIISRKYSEVQFDEAFLAKDMYNDLKSAIENKGKCYLFLDELQEVDGWEKVVNNLLENFNVDIYVTGSNSKLMSSEISTYLSGRYVLIPVYTLSFREYLNFKGKGEKEAKKVFDEYLQYGGFPLIGVSNFDINTAYQVVGGIYSAVVTNDIARRHQIRNIDLFDRVVKFIVENVGKTFSANSIANFLKSEKRTISVEAIYNYIKWLEEAFIIYPCQRYDMQGKSVLKTQEKYYLSDISFKYCKLGFNSKMVSAMLENIVYLEFRRRGYEVYIGKNGTKEIDFIGERRGEKVYIQVCSELPLNSHRESENLMDIKDHYRKYIVAKDELATGYDNGIQLMHIVDFLLKESW